MADVDRFPSQFYRWPAAQQEAYRQLRAKLDAPDRRVPATAQDAMNPETAAGSD